MHGVFTEYVARGVLSGLMWSASAVELTTYAALSALELKLSSATMRLSSIPWKDYFAVALCISLGRGFTWVGYGTLSYPTVILFKSSKILFVMLTGLVILKKRYTMNEYIAAVLAMSGLYIFSRADVESSHEDSSKNESLVGIGVICLAVVCEATVSTLQERALRKEQRSLAEMIFVTNGIGSILLYIIAGLQGELHLLGSKLQENPRILVWLLATVVLAYGYLLLIWSLRFQVCILTYTFICFRGTYAFTACIKGFGAVVATGMGIARKFFSVLTSYFVFPKLFVMEHQVRIVSWFL
jgi:solute carrier family 35 (adenosine 3'-phospho 5'-phosphosulfate transporter), member B3